MTKNGRTRDPCATISTHILCMEDDAQKRKAHEEAEAFQPTSCAWGTTSKIYSKSGNFSTQPASLMRGDDNNRTKSNEA